MKGDNLYYEVPVAPKIVGGEGCFEAMGEELRAIGAVSAILLCDEAAEKALTAEKVRIALTAAGVRTGANYMVADGNAAFSSVYELRDIYRINNCDSIVACGGEDTVNTAKALRMLLSSQAVTLDEIAGVDVAKSKVTVPFAVIPAGVDTSSSVTRSAFLKKEDGEGREFRSSLGKADVCVVDAGTDLGASFRSIAVGAVEVLAGSIESFVSLNAGKLTKCMDLFAMRAIRDSLDKALEDPGDATAMWQLRQAGLLSGLAYDTAGAGLVRAMTNALTVVCGGRREEYSGIVLPEVLRFNLESRKDDYAEALYYVVGDDRFASTAADMRAETFVSTVSDLTARLYKEAGVARTLGERGLKEEDVSSVAASAAGDYSLMTNPVRATAEDIAEILRRLL